ncbi:unnamed protein product, partial [Amoebophrya sp. A25]|eukprot:GSA25T00001027001.1
MGSNSGQRASSSFAATSSLVKVLFDEIMFRYNITISETTPAAGSRVSTTAGREERWMHMQNIVQVEADLYGTSWDYSSDPGRLRELQHDRLIKLLGRFVWNDEGGAGYREWAKDRVDVANWPLEALSHYLLAVNANLGLAVEKVDLASGTLVAAASPQVSPDTLSAQESPLWLQKVAVEWDRSLSAYIRHLELDHDKKATASALAVEMIWTSFWPFFSVLDKAPWYFSAENRYKIGNGHHHQRRREQVAGGARKIRELLKPMEDVVKSLEARPWTRILEQPGYRVPRDVTHALRMTFYNLLRQAKIASDRISPDSMASRQEEEEETFLQDDGSGAGTSAASTSRIVEDDEGSLLSAEVFLFRLLFVAGRMTISDDSPTSDTATNLNDDGFLQRCGRRFLHLIARIEYLLFFRGPCPTYGHLVQAE